ncbi:MFS transporter, partial [Leuconostoc mesenteroides]|uniref:MFS transporter n=1 Tax=Leuconostoc mesenteroides TaxID=1245 RepID=UPI001CBD11B4
LNKSQPIISNFSFLIVEKLDIIGWLLLSLFFVSGIFVIERISTHGLVNLLSLLMTLAMFVGIIGYILYAKRVDNPLLSPEIFKFKVFRFGIAAAFVAQIVNLTFNYAIPMVLQIVLLKNPQVAGLTLLPGALSYAMMAIISGRLYDRYSARLPITIGVTLMFVGTLLIAFIPINLISLTGGFMVIQIGAGFWFGNNMTYSVSSVPVEFQSSGNSIFSATTNYSAAVGIALAAGIIATFQKQAINVRELASSTHIGALWTFRVDIVLIVLAAILSLSALGSIRK